MIIEREQNNIVIKLDASLIAVETIQKFANYFRLLESNAQNNGTQEQADELARKSQENWWAENKQQFIK